VTSLLALGLLADVVIVGNVVVLAVVVAVRDLWPFCALKGAAPPREPLPG
jgi:hypothetical protein